MLLKRCDRFAKGRFTEMNVEQQSNEKPRANAGLFFYLLCPARATVDRLGDTRGVKLLPKALPTVGLLGKEAAGPVLLHVGACFVDPTGA